MEKDFKSLFNDALLSRSITSQKLAEISKVPERYVEALRAGNFEVLPSAPYVRGYLHKIAQVIGINPDEYWELYKKEVELRKSGAQDILPGNRFSLTNISKGKVALFAVIFLLVVYGGFRFQSIVGAPSLEVTNPNQATILTSLETIHVEGRVNPSNKLSINNESVQIDKEGNFRKEIRLEKGINILEFKVRQLLGRETGVVKKIIYTPEKADENATSTATSTASSTPIAP